MFTEIAVLRSPECSSTAVFSEFSVLIRLWYIPGCSPQTAILCRSPESAKLLCVFNIFLVHWTVWDVFYEEMFCHGGGCFGVKDGCRGCGPALSGTLEHVAAPLSGRRGMRLFGVMLHLSHISHRHWEWDTLSPRNLARHNSESKPLLSDGSCSQILYT